MRREVEASLLHDLRGNVDLQEYACEGCAMSPEACSRECCQGVLSSPPLPRSHVVRVQCDGESAIVRGEMAAFRSCVDDHEGGCP